MRYEDDYVKLHTPYLGSHPVPSRYLQQDKATVNFHTPEHSNKSSNSVSEVHL